MFDHIILFSITWLSARFLFCFFFRYRSKLRRRKYWLQSKERFKTVWWRICSLKGNFFKIEVWCWWKSIIWRHFSELNNIFIFLYLVNINLIQVLKVNPWKKCAIQIQNKVLCFLAGSKPSEYLLTTLRRHRLNFDTLSDPRIQVDFVKLDQLLVREN